MRCLLLVMIGINTQVASLPGYHGLLLEQMLVQAHELVYLGLYLTLVTTTSWHLHRVGVLERVRLVEFIRLMVRARPLMSESTGSSRHAGQLRNTTSIHEAKVVLALMIILSIGRVRWLVLEKLWRWLRLSRHLLLLLLLSLVYFDIGRRLWLLLLL